MCVEAVDKIVGLWETSNDEDKYGMARHLFEHVIYDLDEQRIVDFRLKPSANRFLVLRHALYLNKGEDNDKQGTKGVRVPVGLTDTLLDKESLLRRFFCFLAPLCSSLQRYLLTKRDRLAMMC